MPEMYCPRCGKELELDSGEIRFCRYCGLSLADTKDVLHGYSEQKRTGFSIVTGSYALLLIVTLLLHGRYVSLDTRWIYWLLTALIVISASFFCSAAVSASMPALFSKMRIGGKSKLEADGDTRDTLPGAVSPKSLGAPTTIPLEAPGRDQREAIKEPRSVIEGTTRKLSDERRTD